MNLKSRFLLVCVTVFFITLFTSIVYGVNEIQTVAGGATIQSLMSTLESASTKQEMMSMAEKEVYGEENVSTGVSYVYSDNVRIYMLPLSYAINDQYVVGLTISQLYKRKKGYFEDEIIENEGLGDVSYFIRHILTKKRYRFASTLTLKTPTGYYQRYEDNEEKQPLGTGSYDWIIGGSLIYKPEVSEKLRYTSSVSYRMNGDSSYKADTTFEYIPGTYDFKAKDGNVFNISVGCVYFSGLENLLFYGEASYLNIQRGTIGYSDQSKVVDVSMDRKDAMTAIDLTAGFKYGFYKDSALRLGVSMPAYTEYDADVESSKERQMVGDFGVDYVF